MLTTLNEFIIQSEHNFPDATGKLTAVLQDLTLAAKIVNREVNKAGLVDILGAAGSTNVQGEEVKKLDVFANDQFIRCLKNGGQCAGIASEENDDFIAFDTHNAKNAKYVVCMDPLDGSSNIDVNVSIGTIFGIYERISPIGEPCTIADFLQKGTQLVAAAYVVYGSSTMLVYSTGEGVNGFTLDPSIGEFCLSHPNIQTPKQGKIYSINEANRAKYPESINEFVDYCKVLDKATKRPYSARYIGSMVADLHRNLIKGGVFIYPAMTTHPNGKLRLLYECNPMAFLVEKAGGTASNGEQRILDLQPTRLHQRTPIFIGSTNMVEKALSFVGTVVNSG